jgi:hypothetical protein
VQAEPGRGPTAVLPDTAGDPSRTRIAKVFEPLGRTSRAASLVRTRSERAREWRGPSRTRIRAGEWAERVLRSQDAAELAVCWWIEMASPEVDLR